VPEAATYDPLGAAGTWRRNSAKLIVYALLGLFALCYMLPLCIVVLNSFRDLSDITRNGLIGLPHSFSLNYWS
jgi:glucose/mannose transport system permease protein